MKSLEFYILFSEQDSTIQTTNQNSSQSLKCFGVGTVAIPLRKNLYLIAENARYCPDAVVNLISTNSLEQNKMHFMSLAGNAGHIYRTISPSPLDDHPIIMRTIKRYGLHMLPPNQLGLSNELPHTFATISIANTKIGELTSLQTERFTMRRQQELEEYQRRHIRLGHPSPDRIRYMQSRSTTTDLVPIRFPNDIPVCEICVQSTRTMAPRSGTKTQNQQPGHMLYFDGLQITPPYLNKFPYVLLAADQGSTFNWHAYAEHKDEFLVHAMRIIERVKDYHYINVRTIRLDAGELGTSDAFKEYCETKGISLEPTARKTPSSDGGAERPIGTITNMTRALTIQARLPWNRWGLAFDHSVYLKNILPVISREISSPIETLTGSAPRTQHLRSFGCQTWYRLNPTDIKSKLEPRARPAVYVGCQSPSLVKLVDQSTGNLIIRMMRDCVFDETSFPGIPAFHKSQLGLSDLTTTAVDNSQSTSVDSKVFNAILRRVIINNNTLSNETLDALRRNERTPKHHYSVIKAAQQTGERTDRKV
jgi:hypothetical protein